MKDLKLLEDARAVLKQNRRNLTDSIQQWIENEITGTNNWAKFAYLNITRAVTKSCFTNYKGNMPLSKKNFRDNLTEEEAYRLARMEFLAADLIDDIDRKFPDADAKEKYKRLSEDLFKIGETLVRIHSATIAELFEEDEQEN